MKKNLQSILAATIIILATKFSAGAQVASNPPYTLDQAVIAGGGGTSTDAGNIFSVVGSIGQTVTDASSALPFTIKSGFFAAVPLAPTAALTTVSGRTMTAQGRGIRNVLIKMTDSSGAVHIAYSSAFGYYRFTNVQAGETYVFTVKGRRFEFAQPTRVLSINEDTGDVDFIAIPQL